MRSRAVFVIAISLAMMIIGVPLVPRAHAAPVVTTLPAHIYSGTSANTCLSGSPTSSGHNSGANTQLFGLVNLGLWLYDSDAQQSSCNGYGSLRAFAWVDGDWATADANANVTFIDTVTIPNNGQKYSVLSFTGQYYLYGWQGAFASGTASYAYANTNFQITDKIVRSDGVVANPGWDESPTIPTGTTFNPSCNAGIVQWPPAFVFCNVTPQKISGQNQFSHDSAYISPGTYYVILSFVTTAHAEIKGAGVSSQSSGCFELVDNANGDCAKVLSGTPPAPVSCPSGLTGPNGQCYYVSWMQTSYTETDYPPADPSYSVSSSQSSFTVSSSGGANNGAQQTVQTTITVTPSSGYVSPAPNYCTYLSAYSYFGFTKHFFINPNTGSYISDACLQFTGSGSSISLTMIMWIPFCTSYQDAILIYTTDFTNEVAGFVIPFTVNNTCSFKTSVGSQTLYTTSAAGASTGFTTTNQGGPNYTCCVTDFAGFANYTDTSTGQTVNCVTNVSCPTTNFSSPTNGNPITSSLGIGATQTANIVTHPIPGTPSGNYLMWAASGIEVQDNSTAGSPLFVECTPSACYYAGGSWSNVIIAGQFMEVRVQDFGMAANPASTTILAGATGSSTITVTSINGFTGTVNLSASVSPSTGLSCSPLGPPSVTLGSSATSTLSCSGSTAGSYTVTVTGSAGALTHPTTVGFNVGDFSISGSPGSLTLSGTSNPTGQSQITVKSLGSFSGTLNVNATAPNGITVSPSTTSVTLTSGSTSTYTATVSVATSVPAGAYTATFTGKSGSLIRTGTLTINVISDFGVSATSPIALNVGSSASVTITVAGANGFTGTVNLSDTVPAGLTCNPLSPTSVALTSTTTSGTSTLTCSSTTPGTYNVVITASSGSISHTTSISFQVQDFTFGASPNPVTVYGTNVYGSSLLTVTPVNGFAGTVTLTASPSGGLTCYPLSSISGGSGSTYLYCYGVPGTYTVTVTATNGSLSHSVTVTYIIRDFSVTITPSTINIPDARSGSVTIQLQSLNGFSGTISLNVFTGMPYCATWNIAQASLQLQPGGTNSTTLNMSIPSTCLAQNSLVELSAFSTQAYHYPTFTLSTSDFSISPQYTTFGIANGGSITDTVTYYSDNNYPATTISESLSFPNNYCCLSFGWYNPTNLPSGGSASTPVTVSASGTGVVENALFIVTGNDGHISRSSTLQISINDYNVTRLYPTISVYIGSGTAEYLQVFPYFGIPLTNMTVVPTSVPSCITLGASNPGYFNLGPTTGYSFITIPVTASSTCTAGTVSATVTLTGVSYHAYDKAVTFNISILTPPSGGGGGGGSVASGTLITMADGSTQAVQNIKVGDSVMGFNVNTGQSSAVVVTQVKVVNVNTQLTIYTMDGLPFRTDANPLFRLHVMVNGQIVFIPVTTIKPGDFLYNYNERAWVEVTNVTTTSGTPHIVYDITVGPLTDFIANGYADCPKACPN